MDRILDATRLGKADDVPIPGICQGRIAGIGRDIVGPFDFTGTYDLKMGRVVMTKQYERAHRVEYDGTNQNDGMWLWGIWNIRSLTRGMASLARRRR